MRAVRLDQNRPNPFNPSTTISYTLPKSEIVVLKIYDALGQEITVLVNGVQPSGTHTVLFDAREMASGLYFYRVKAGEFVQTRMMALVR